MRADEITLTLPRERPFFRVAHLVLGGLAVRLDLTFENLEDLQLALAGLLEQPDQGGDVTVTLRLRGETIEAEVGPFENGHLLTSIQAGGKGELSLGRLLDAVVDGVEIEEREGGLWVGLTKTVKAASG